MKIFKFILPISVLVVVIGSLWLLWSNAEEDTEQSPVFIINDARIAVEIADTQESRTRGLSDHEELGESEGMLFIFEEEDYYGFHMKDMDFGIDMIWMDDEMQVVDLTEGFSPDSYPDIVRPSEPVGYVLEVYEGFIEHHDVARGMQGEYLPTE